MYSSCGKQHACMVILIVISFCWNSSVASWFLINFHCILCVISLDIKIKWRNYNELVQFISFWFFVTSSSKLQCWTTENCGLCCIGNKIRFLYKKVSDSSSLTPFFWSLLKLPEVAKNWHFALQRNKVPLHRNWSPSLSVPCLVSWCDSEPHIPISHIGPTTLFPFPSVLLWEETTNILWTVNVCSTF